MDILEVLRWGGIWLGVVIVVVTPTAHSQAENGATPQARRCVKQYSLEEFRAHALSRSPVVAAIDREYQLEVARALETEAWQNPELQLEVTRTRMQLQGANDNQVQASIGQPMRLSNFGTKARVGALLRSAGDATKHAQGLEFTQKLALKFHALRALEETDQMLRASEAEAARRVVAIREGVAKGRLSRGEEGLFEGEKGLLRAMARENVASIARLQRELSVLSGVACVVTTAGMSESILPIPSIEDLRERAQRSGISALARARLASSLAAARGQLARLDAAPALTPRVVYQHTNDGGDFLGAGLTVALPLWDTNRAERTRAAAEQKLADSSYNLLNSEGIDTQLELLRIAAESAREQAEIYAREVVPAFDRALRSNERLYAEGKGSVLQVWQIARALHEARVRSIQLHLEAAVVRAELSLLVGEEV